MFQREGADLHCEMPISFAIAALGGEIEIPTLDGHAKIKIPAETQSGQVFRLRNKGIRPVRGSVTGDLFCHVAIETPVKLTVAAEGAPARIRSDQRGRSRRAQSARQVVHGQGAGFLRAVNAPTLTASLPEGASALDGPAGADSAAITTSS